MRAFCSWFNPCAADATPSPKRVVQMCYGNQKTQFSGTFPFLSLHKQNSSRMSYMTSLSNCETFPHGCPVAAIRCTLNGLMEKPVILDHVTEYWFTGLLVTKKRRENLAWCCHGNRFYLVYTRTVCGRGGHWVQHSSLGCCYCVDGVCCTNEKIGMVWMRRQKHRLGRGREGVLLSEVTQSQPVQLSGEYDEGRVTCDSDSACASRQRVWRQSDMWLRPYLCSWVVSMKAEWHVTQTQPGVWRQSYVWIRLSLCSWETSIRQSYMWIRLSLCSWQWAWRQSHAQL